MSRTPDAADGDLWFAVADAPEAEGHWDDGTESLTLGRDRAGRVWLLSKREVMSRERVDPEEFTYAPFTLLVHAAMRARSLDWQLPPSLVKLSVDAGPPRRSGFSVSQLAIRDTPLVAVGRRIDGLWAVSVAHEGSWILALSPSKNPRLA